MLRLVCIILLWYVIIYVVTILLTMDGTEIQMRMWRLIRDICQHIAYQFGRAGIWAENHYNLSRSAII